MLRMRRRSARVMVCMPPGEARDRVVERLGVSGFLRVERVSDLAAMKEGLAPSGATPPLALLLVDLALAGAGDVEPLAAVRSLERELEAFGDLPAVMLCEWVDPTLFLALGSQIRILPHLPATPQDERDWIACLDGMAGF
jgi:hypothetical protein